MAAPTRNTDTETLNEEHSDKNVISVLETDNLTDFLARAELADRQFASEREQFVVLDENAQQVHFDESNSKFDFAECGG